MIAQPGLQYLTINDEVYPKPNIQQRNSPGFYSIVVITFENINIKFLVKCLSLKKHDLFKKTTIQQNTKYILKLHTSHCVYISAVTKNLRLRKSS